MTWGVRGRITVVSTLVVLIVLTLTALALVAAQRTVLTDNVDEVLLRHSDVIAGVIDEGGFGGTLAGQGDEEAFAEVVDASGRVLAATVPTLDGPRPPLPTDDRAYAVTLRAADGTDFRVLSRRHGGVVIRAGQPVDDVTESTATLAAGLLIAVPAASGVLAALVWLLVGRVLRPVEDIRVRVADITGSNLNRRVPEPRSHDEVARLAATMNEMLERLEASADRQEQFVEDASHELRSPLARIRSELEVDLAHPDSADNAATRRSILEETANLQRLVDDLLTLARRDVSGAGVAGERTREIVDLDDLVLSEAARLRGAGRAQVDLTGLSGAQVRGSAPQLARVLRNLLDNAVEHGGRRVTVTLEERGPEAVLGVADDGPGIPAEFRNRVFERFVRVDQSRSAGHGGTGLGLAIARQIVTEHGGSIAIDPDVPAGTRFVVRLPLATPAVS